MFTKLAISLERLDALYLRAKAVNHFKEEFPEYSPLKLSLRNEDLIISLNLEEDLGNVICKMHDIKHKSIVAIGISHVILEVEGTEKMRVGNMVGTIDLVENIENGAVSYVEDAIPQQIGGTKKIPANVIPLISIENFSIYGQSLTLDDLMACLDKDVQTQFKIERREEVATMLAALDDEVWQKTNSTPEQVLEVVEVHEMLGNYGIRAQYTGAVLVWFFIWKQLTARYSIANLVLNAHQNLVASPYGQFIQAATPPVKTETPPSRRGRKAAAPEEATIVEDGEAKERVAGSNFRGATKIMNAESTMNLLNDNKFTAFANKVLETQKTKSSDRTEELIESALNNDSRWQRFFAPIMKAYLKGIPEGDREKAEKKATSGILKAFRAKSSNNISEAA